MLDASILLMYPYNLIDSYDCSRSNYGYSGINRWSWSACRNRQHRCKDRRKYQRRTGWILWWWKRRIRNLHHSVWSGCSTYMPKVYLTIASHKVENKLHASFFRGNTAKTFWMHRTGHHMKLLAFLEFVYYGTAVNSCLAPNSSITPPTLPA
jgi:hypothetical protein